MPKAVHDRAMRLLPEMKKTYPPKKAKQVAFAVASQQGHAKGQVPKGFGTAKGKREAKRKFDKPPLEYKSLKEAQASALLRAAGKGIAQEPILGRAGIAAFRGNPELAAANLRRLIAMGGAAPYKRVFKGQRFPLEGPWAEVGKTGSATTEAAGRVAVGAAQRLGRFMRHPAAVGALGATAGTGLGIASSRRHHAETAQRAEAALEELDRRRREDEEAQRYLEEFLQAEPSYGYGDYGGYKFGNLRGRAARNPVADLLKAASQDERSRATLGTMRGDASMNKKAARLGGEKRVDMPKKRFEQGTEKKGEAPSMTSRERKLAEARSVVENILDIPREKRGQMEGLMYGPGGASAGPMGMDPALLAAIEGMGGGFGAGPGIGVGRPDELGRDSPVARSAGPQAVGPMPALQGIGAEYAAREQLGQGAPVVLAQGGPGVPAGNVGSPPGFAGPLLAANNPFLFNPPAPVQAQAPAAKAPAKAPSTQPAKSKSAAVPTPAPVPAPRPQMPQLPQLNLQSTQGSALGPGLTQAMTPTSGTSDFSSVLEDVQERAFQGAKAKYARLNLLGSALANSGPVVRGTPTKWNVPGSIQAPPAPLPPPSSSKTGGARPFAGEGKRAQELTPGERKERRRMQTGYGAAYGLLGAGLGGVHSAMKKRLGIRTRVGRFAPLIGAGVGAALGVGTGRAGAWARRGDRKMLRELEAESRREAAKNAAVQPKTAQSFMEQHPALATGGAALAGASAAPILQRALGRVPLKGLPIVGAGAAGLAAYLASQQARQRRAQQQQQEAARRLFWQVSHQPEMMQ